MPARRADVRVARAPACLVTCEHGGNAIPREYRPLFRDAGALLASHRGYDPGALSMAKALARALRAPLIAATTSRLVVELNRSPGRQFRASPVMRYAPAALREEATRRYYVPYRADVEAFVAEALRAGRRVVHVSSHSFTPVLDGAARDADVGLLYDPARIGERDLCVRWQRALAAALPALVVRRNYPYRGRSDGLTTSLRTRHPGAYFGIELEINQTHVAGDALPAALCAAVADALVAALAPATTVNRAVPGRRTRASATTRASPPPRRSAASCRCGSRG
jgi:predicted N-formylglutamate amidohydrolase